MQYKLKYDSHGDKHFNKVAPIESKPPKDRIASIYICGDIVQDLKLKKEKETDFTIQIGVNFSTIPVTLEYHMYPDNSVEKYGIGTTKKSVK